MKVTIEFKSCDTCPFQDEDWFGASNCMLPKRDNPRISRNHNTLTIHPDCKLVDGETLTMKEWGEG